MFAGSASRMIHHYNSSCSSAKKGGFLVIGLRGWDDTVMLFLGIKSTFWAQQFACFMYLDKFNILLCTDAITCVWYNPKTTLVLGGYCDLTVKLIYTSLVVLQKTLHFL